jgi:hypothetical protein
MPTIAISMIDRSIDRCSVRLGRMPLASGYCNARMNSLRQPRMDEEMRETLSPRMWQMSRLTSGRAPLPLNCTRVIHDATNKLS